MHKGEVSLDHKSRCLIVLIVVALINALKAQNIPLDDTTIFNIGKTPLFL